MVTILSFLVVLMILVMAHEVGHLIAAKRLGMEVETFAIGFGPKILGVRRAGTNYVVKLIPLGGYVQLGEASPHDRFRPGSPHFSERPPLDKIIVAFSGPLANLLLAVAVLSIASFVGMETPAFLGQPARLGWVSAASPAASAGLRAGDRIVDVDGKGVTNWSDLVKSLPLSENDLIMVGFVRDGRMERAALSRVSRVNVGLAPRETVTVGAVVTGSPAEGAGLRPGDVIREIDGQPLRAWAQFQEMVSRAGQPLTVTVERGGTTTTTELAPRLDPAAGKRLAGISYRPQTVVSKHAPLAALANGFSKTGEIVSDSLDTFRGLLVGSISLKALGGPVAIAKASGSTARSGLGPLMVFLAFLSIQLAIFNLLPFIPVVDGGQITLFLFETVIRRPIGAVSLERFSKVGWAAMGVLILFVTYNDILRLF